MFDLITVTHNDTNEILARGLRAALASFESEISYTFYVHSNRDVNLGFAKACNAGAFRDGADSPYIGFLNPDLVVEGPILRSVLDVFESEPRTVITGERFSKPGNELNIWGVKDWVCGAAFFVRRDWFTEVGGFDEGYEWSWEETDLIRLAESSKKRVHSIKLPVRHSSPTDDSLKDSCYKDYNFHKGQIRFSRKWR